MLRAIKEIVGAEVSAEAALTSAGLDSLGAVELRKELAGLTGLELPSTLVFDYPSAQAIAELVAGQLAPAQPDGTALCMSVLGGSIIALHASPPCSMLCLLHFVRTTGARDELPRLSSCNDACRESSRN